MSDPAMPAARRYVSGWVSGLSIDQLVAVRPQAFFAAPWVLISSLDSSPDVAAVVSRVPALMFKPASEAPLVVSGRDLERIVDSYRLFTGFDELWLCSEPPPTAPPDAASIVAPEQLSDEPPTETVAWMSGNGCFAAFGDGIGLNYVCAVELADEFGFDAP